MESKEYTFDRVVRILITIGVIFGVIWFINLISAVLIPFLIACLLAYLMNPMVNWLESKIKKRALAVFLVITGWLCAFVLFLMWLLPTIGAEIGQLKQLIEVNVAHLRDNNDRTSEILIAAKEWIEKVNVKEWIDADNISKMANQVLPGFWKGISNVFGVLFGIFGIVTVFLYLIFILFDFENINQGWRKLIPPKYAGILLELVEDMEMGMNAYFKAQGKIVVIVGILFAIGFKLIGIPLGILLGLGIGLLNFVPYLQLAGLIPAIFLAALHSINTGMNFWIVMGLVLLVFAVVQLIQESILTPKIMGDLTGLNPAVILLSLSIWGSLLGITGMIIALPMTTLILSYYKRYILKEPS